MQDLVSREDYDRLILDYDTWLFDCDGVIWNGDHLTEGVVEVLGYLRRQKKRIIFVTNNATKSRQSYKGKFDKLGVQADVVSRQFSAASFVMVIVDQDEIFGSAYASAVYLSSVVKLPKNKKVYVIGETGVEEELAEEGYQYLGGTDPQDNTVKPFKIENFIPDPDVGAVVCGLDTSINYTKYCKAYQYLRNSDCLFIATNEDSTYPAGGGILPGGGSIMAPLVLASKRKPVATGKPNTTMLDCIRAKHDFDPKRSIMVGDRLETDIEFGKKGGLSTLLVLTGITAKEDLRSDAISQDQIPDFVTSSLGDLRILFQGSS